MNVEMEKLKKLLISVFGDFEISLRNIINCKSQHPAIKKSEIKVVSKADMVCIRTVLSEDACNLSY